MKEIYNTFDKFYLEPDSYEDEDNQNESEKSYSDIDLITRSDKEGNVSDEETTINIQNDLAKYFKNGSKIDPDTSYVILVKCESILEQCEPENESD